VRNYSHVHTPLEELHGIVDTLMDSYGVPGTRS
jgi:hypothetical protein